MMTGKPESAGGQTLLRTRLLLGTLILLAVAYLILQPTLRRIQENVARMRRESVKDQAQLAQMTQLKSALDTARAAVAQSPLDADANAHMASLLLQTGDAAGSLPFLETAVRLRPADIPSALLLGDAYERCHRQDAAIPIYRAILKRDPDQVVALNRLAWLAISYGWIPEGRTLLERALRVQPDDPHLQDELAFVYLQLREYRQAEQLLLSVRKAHPQEPDLWLPLGDVYAKQAHYKEAAELRREALALKPGDLRLTQDLAQALYDSGDVAAAVSTWQTILAADPRSAGAHYGLGVAYRKLGRTSDAIRELETVYGLAPDTGQTRALLGPLYLQNGRSDEGNRLLREYREQHARAEEFARVGFLLISKPQSPDVHFQMAEVYRQQNNVPRMVVELRKTLELDPHYAQAQHLLETVAPQNPP